MTIELTDRRPPELVARRGVARGFSMTLSSDVIQARTIWYAPPHNLRIELRHHGELLRAGGRNDANWWIWTRDLGMRRGQEEAGFDKPPFPPFLDPVLLEPARLLGLWRFDNYWGGLHQGRDVTYMSGVPRSGTNSRDYSASVCVDRASGILLTQVYFQARREVRHVEVQNIRALTPATPVSFDRL